MRCMRASPAQRQRGLTLVEMMVALAAGLMVVLAASALLNNARAAYQDIDDAGHVQETGRMALAHLADAVRQAGHLPWDSLGGRAPPRLSPALRGIDDSRQANELDPSQGRFDAAAGNGYNRSDLLMLGFFSAARGMDADISNCAGATATTGSAPLEESERSWNIYYIAPGVGNEPELRCRYRGKNGAWTSDAIVRGVEAMQLRYGVDTDFDGLPDRWLDASAIAGDAWRQVKLVRIALLVRGKQARPGAAVRGRSYELFAQAGRPNEAWRFTEKDGDRRLRAVFQTTVYLRNADAGGGPPP